MSAAGMRACTGVAFFGALTLGTAVVPRAVVAFPSRVVHLSGDGVAPGWYAASSLHEAVCAAREAGCGDHALVATAPVADGDHILVHGDWLVVEPTALVADTTDATTEAVSGGPSAALALGRPMSLNRASQADLETLPGIGPALAKRLVDGRPYARFEDIDRVKGIGPAKLARLRGRVEP